MGCGAGGSAEDLRLVQLGVVDLDPDLLAGPGGELAPLIGAGAAVERHGPAEWWDALPMTGWRRVHRRSAEDGERTDEMYAAPHPDDATCWATVWLGRNMRADDGSAILSLDPGPVPVRPGRAARRIGLRLSWPGPVRAVAGTVPGLTVVLHNDLDETWTNVADDSLHVHAMLLDTDGRRIQSRSYFYSSSRSLPPLRPHESRRLPVDLITRDVQALPPGTYGLLAHLTDLRLESDIGELELTGPA